MSKVIAVTGATGSQGGGVVNMLRKTPGWKVRALTRNLESESAKKLVAGGVEVVHASFDDEDSLVKAFDGVHAVFAVTNWWEHLFSGKSQNEAGVIDEEQGMRIACTAAQTATLEHYVWSTCPSAKHKTKGEHVSPHMDYKTNVDVRIKSELPELAKKTTYLPDAKILLSGDMTVNPGIWVRQVLANGSKTFGKYANVALEKLTFQEQIDIWSEVTGKKGIFVECTTESWTRLWGTAGAELASQFKFGEICDPWEESKEFLKFQELGIDIREVVGFRGTIEGLKHLF